MACSTKRWVIDRGGQQRDGNDRSEDQLAEVNGDGDARDQTRCLAPDPASMYLTAHLNSIAETGIAALIVAQIFGRSSTVVSGCFNEIVAGGSICRRQGVGSMTASHLSRSAGSSKQPVWALAPVILQNGAVVAQ